MTEGKKIGDMKFEDWDIILDAKLLYNLYDDFECRLADISSEDNSREVDFEKMERMLRAVTMFSARALATADTALVITGGAMPNDIVMTYIEHLIHSYQHLRGHYESDEDDE
jgi:hypothetical protein